MTRQYLRSYTLHIDNGENRKSINGLRISFEIIKSLQSTPNICKLVIFNPNEQTKSILQDRLTKITLNAGYAGYEKLLFTGRVRTSLINRQREDETITVFSGDGQRDWEQAFFNKTFSGSIRVDEVIKQIASTFTETATNDIASIGNISDKLLGQSLSGMSRDIMDTFAKQYGFQWSIQDNVFNITKNNAVDTSSGIIVVNALTGMIGEPTITERGADVKTLLNPEAKPNRQFRIESIGAGVQQGNLYLREAVKTRAQGVYKIFEVIHKGDTHSNTWDSTLKGQGNYVSNR